MITGMLLRHTNAAVMIRSNVMLWDAEMEANCTSRGTQLNCFLGSK